MTLKPKFKEGQKLYNMLGDTVIIKKVLKVDKQIQNYLVYDTVKNKEYNMREEEFKFSE